MESNFRSNTPIILKYYLHCCFTVNSIAPLCLKLCGYGHISWYSECFGNLFFSMKTFYRRSDLQIPKVHFCSKSRGFPFLSICIRTYLYPYLEDWWLRRKCAAYFTAQLPFPKSRYFYFLVLTDARLHRMWKAPKCILCADLHKQLKP